MDTTASGNIKKLVQTASNDLSAQINALQAAYDHLQAVYQKVTEAEAGASNGAAEVHKAVTYTPTVGKVKTFRGWPTDPKERSKEMKRRQKVALRKKLAAMKG